MAGREQGTIRARGDAVVWAGLASCAGALGTVAPATTSATALVTALLLVRGGARAVALLMAAALVVGFVRARAAITRHEGERARMVSAQAPWPSRCAVTGVVSSSPALASGGLRIAVEDAILRCRDGPSFPVSQVLLYVPLEVAKTAARDDHVSAIASLAPPYRFWNDGTGDPRPGAARRGIVLSGSADDLVVERRGWGIRSSIDRARAHVRDRIVATFPADTEAMARALALGEDDLAEEDQRAFRKSGLAHLLAVSGMHLVLVVIGAVAAIRALLVRIPLLAARFDVGRLAAALGLPVAWLYAELAGGSGSAIRAAWMCTVALSARLLARRSMAWRALGISLVCMSLFDPLASFDVSFVLSALATMGIVGLARRFEATLAERAPRVPAFVAKPLATTLAATVACAPVLTLMAPELPVGGLVANVIAVPLGDAAALPLCLGHALLSIWPAAERGCATAASGALTLVRLVARAFTWSTLPVPSPTVEQLGALAIATAGVVLGSGPRGWVLGGMVSLLGLEGLERWHGSPRGSLRVTFIDVGQGDAALVDLPDGSAMLVDGGGLVGSPIDVGQRAILPLLAARRRQRLDVVVLSHPHPDHYLGLVSTFGRMTPRAFWDTGQGEIEGTGGAYRTMLEGLRRGGVPIRRPVDLCGAHLMGGAWVDVLAPCPGVAPDRPPNDNSFVIRIRFGERAVLLVGDAEREEEDVLVHTAAVSLRADVLKVGHHGSRTSSSPAFVAAVAPSVAVVSCGIRNRFGHPNASTIATLSRSGARVLRTDLGGSIVITTDGHSLDVRPMRPMEAL